MFGKLSLSVCFGDYDRTRALVDGAVQIEGVDPVFNVLGPEEAFFRTLMHDEFDISELSLSSYSQTVALGTARHVGVPVFLSRTFRHNSLYIRTDRVREPADLKGKRVGLPEYALTANVWARALLEDEYGVKPADVIWIRGGLEQPGRPEKVPLKLPPDVRLETAPPGATLSRMLAEGELDAFMGPRAPSCFDQGHPKVARLFPDTVAAARAYFERTRIFPIMHFVAIRRDLAERNPWLPVAVFKAFQRSKEICLEKLTDTSAPKVTLPFLEESLTAARALMGFDFWPYGLEPNRKVLETFLDHHHRQGLSARRVAVEELFHPATISTHRI